MELAVKLRTARIPWNKGLKGIHLSPKSEFKKGERTGADGTNYNFGLSYYKREKRWFIVCRDGKKVNFARAMIEGYTKTTLTKNEIVHHKNHRPTDDRLENLEVLTRARHMEIHDPHNWRNRRK